MVKDNIKLFMGMDIGYNSIRVADLSTTNDGYILEYLHESEIKTEFTENGSVVDYGTLVQELKKIVNTPKFPNTQVAVAIKGPAIITKRVSVNVDNYDEFNEQFRWIVDQYAYVDQEAMAIDYKLLGASERYGYADVMIIASKRDVLQDFLSVTAAANIKLSAVEPEVLALERMYKVLHLDTTGVDAIVHVGVLGTLVVFMRHGTFMFCKPIMRGGMHFTKTLQEDFDLTIEDAERYKLNPDSFSEPTKFRDALNRCIAYDYGVELDRVFTFYKLLGGSEPSKIILSGAASQTLGLREYLEEKYSVPVNYMDPWVKVELAEGINIPEHKKYTYNIALGLALSGVV